MPRSLREFLDRLKVVPLTIVLTVLLWLYADANLTSTVGDLPVHITVVAAAGTHRTLQVLKPAQGDFQITIQGSRRRVDQVRRLCTGQAPMTRQDLANLVYVVHHPGRLRLGAPNSLDAKLVLNSLAFFRRRHVAVSAVTPARIQLRVDQTVTVSRPILFRALRHVPVKISPPTATVSLPRSLLTRVGGAAELRVLAKPLQDVGALRPNTPQTISARLVAIYPGPVNAAVTVAPATAAVTLTVPPQPRRRLFIGIVPVWAGGPPWLLDRYRVQVRPNTLQITVTGPRDVLRVLRRALIRGDVAPLRQRVVAILPINPAWIPTAGWVTHRIHYELPRGVRVLQGPDQVQCRVRWLASAHPAVSPPPAPATGARPKH